MKRRFAVGEMEMEQHLNQELLHWNVVQLLVLDLLPAVKNLSLYVLLLKMDHPLANFYQVSNSKIIIFSKIIMKNFR